jgi:hypothetical protein
MTYQISKDEVQLDAGSTRSERISCFPAIIFLPQQGKLLLVVRNPCFSLSRTLCLSVFPLASDTPPGDRASF